MATDTLIIPNNYCFSVATMVTRKRHIVTFSYTYIAYLVWKRKIGNIRIKRNFEELSRNHRCSRKATYISYYESVFPESAILSSDLLGLQHIFPHYLRNGRGTRFVEALHHKSEGRWFDSRLCHLNFSLTYSFRPHYGPGVDSASNRNEYQEYFLGVNAALPPSCTVVMKSGNLKFLEDLWAAPGL